jgi:hypothetical protein
MKDNTLLRPADAINELKEYRENKYCPQQLHGAIDTAIDTLSQGRQEIGEWEEVVEKDVPVHNRPQLTTYHTSQTCSICKTRVTFIGAKRYIKDNYCPNCGRPMRTR